MSDIILSAAISAILAGFVAWALVRERLVAMEVMVATLKDEMKPLRTRVHDLANQVTISHGKIDAAEERIERIERVLNGKLK